MTPPPAKRQKRHVVLSSDEDDGGLKGETRPVPGALNNVELKTVNGNGPVAQKLPNRPRRKLAAPSKARPARTSSDTTPASSPNKPKKNAKLRQQDSKSKSLYTFFTARAKTQRDAARSESRTPEVEEEDFIEDDSLDEELQRLDTGRPESHKVLDRRKEQRLVPAGKGDQHEVEAVSNASQQFLRVPRPIQSNIRGDERPKVVDEDGRPWAEKYAPTTLEELAVHKKKVADIRTWLEHVLQGRSRKKLLILKGPSGTGKTTTVSLLGPVMGFDITEWRNTIGSELSSESFVSMSAQFEDFLRRSGRFGCLEIFSGSGDNMNASEETAVAATNADRNNIILLEEFPNTFMRSSTALESFRETLLHYLAANTSPLADVSSEHVTPVVIIISETLLTTSTAIADSFTAHRLLGPRILTHPAVSVIDFNPIAPTFIAKALDLVAQKEARTSGRRRTPGPAVLKRLGEIGDVRSAVGSLEFLCLRGDEGSGWSGRVAGKLRRGAKDNSNLTQLEKESLEMVTRREATLGIFHAVGKVVYNKREDVSGPDPAEEPPPQPPDFLCQHARPKVSHVSVDTLIDETGTDTQTFIAALHENYILSCEGPSTIDSINGCIDALSECDVLTPDGRSGTRSGAIGGGFGRGAFQGATTDSLRQGDICFQIAVRGILFALPYPVKRRAQPGSINGVRAAGRGDAQKMFYPTSLRLWRQAEEIEALLDDYINRSAHTNHTDAPYHDHTVEPGDVDTWKSPPTDTLTTNHTSFVAPNDNPPQNLPIPTRSARHEMLLDRLPYLAQIARHRQRHKPNRPTTTAELRQLEKITQFRGIDAQSDDVDEEEDEHLRSMEPLWTTDQPAELSMPASRSRSWKGGGAWRKGDVKEGMDGGFGGRGLVEGGVEKLVLSDDDIED